MTLGDDVARLSRVRPFSLMAREAVQLVAFTCERRRLRSGETLFRADEPADCAYFVLSGAFLLVEAGGRDERVRRVGPGALIGETALYAPVARHVEARAAEDALVARVPRETFRRVLEEYPALAQRIRASIAARARDLVEKLDATRAASFDRPPPGRTNAR